MSTPESHLPKATEAQARLNEWLAHCERLHPKEIDMGLARMHQMRERLGLKFDAPIVMVAGTKIGRAHV